MFCTNCGITLKEGAKFCSSCGKPHVPANVEKNQLPTVALTPQTIFQNQNTPMVQTIIAYEKYCFSCGSIINKAAEICPKCGVNQNKRSSTSAINVYCTSCRQIINKETSTCPYCGVKQENISEKNASTAFLLCIFTAVWHCFYVGKIGSALLKYLIAILCIFSSVLILLFLDGAINDEYGIVGFFLFIPTFLGNTIWWIIDLVMIGKGKYKDRKGNVLKNH